MNNFQQTDQVICNLYNRDSNYSIEIIDDQMQRKNTTLLLKIDRLLFYQSGKNYQHLIYFNDVSDIYVETDLLVIIFKVNEVNQKLTILDEKIFVICYNLQKRLNFCSQANIRLRNLQFLQQLSQSPRLSFVLFQKQLQITNSALLESYIKKMGDFGCAPVMVEGKFEFVKLNNKITNQWPFSDYQLQSQLDSQLPTASDDYQFLLDGYEKFLFSQNQFCHTCFKQLNLQNARSFKDFAFSLQIIYTKCNDYIVNFCKQKRISLQLQHQFSQELDVCVSLYFSTSINSLLHKDYHTINKQIIEACDKLNKLPNLKQICTLNTNYYSINFDIVVNEFRFLNNVIIMSPTFIFEQLENVVTAIQIVLKLHLKEETLLVADDLIPILIFCFIKAGVEKAQSISKIMLEMMPKYSLLGSAGYLQTALQVCIDFVLGFDE